MRELIYTMFINNNLASFHLWWKENLVKHQRVSKYYENDCRSHKQYLTIWPPLGKLCYIRNASMRDRIFVMEKSVVAKKQQHFFTLSACINFTVTNKKYHVSWKYTKISVDNPNKIWDQFPQEYTINRHWRQMKATREIIS